jgi:hypothetical protein
MQLCHGANLLRAGATAATTVFAAGRGAFGKIAIDGNSGVQPTAGDWVTRSRIRQNADLAEARPHSGECGYGILPREIGGGTP